MITFEEAFRIVKLSVVTLDTESIPFEGSLNRVLAEDVKSDMEMPPFDKSAVDGYAYRYEDIDLALEIIETVQAGKMPKKTVQSGQCTQIMTGAPVPYGADRVVPVEDIEIIDHKLIIKKKEQKINISYTAEDVKEGQVVLNKGLLIRPQHIAVFASVGYTNVLTYTIPRVGIISTGDELVEPAQKPGLSQIRNSNSYQLMSQVTAMGALPSYYGIAKDTEDDTYHKIASALSENDLILLTGGVSVGEFDFVADVITRIGFNIQFNSIAVTPGKPTTFATLGRKFCFGLPGNPVSSFVQFELLVKTFLYGMQGYDYSPVGYKLPMGVDYKRKNSTRRYFIPVTVSNGEIFPIEYHGSGHIHAFTAAHGLISLASGISTLKKENSLMYDRFNRKINYLRVSVTDRCNLRCTYCMPPEGIELMQHDDILRFNEIVEVVKYAVGIGIEKVRITGGEPLARKGIVALVKMMSEIKGIKDLSMTTNGILLEQFAQELKDAGLHRINISLDTCDPDKYTRITRTGDIRDVIKGIVAAKKAGLDPIKINCVIKKSQEEPDALGVAQFCNDMGLKIRYIKEMDLEKGSFSNVIGGSGGICTICNRLRLTANGNILPCLFNDIKFNVRELGIEKAFEMALECKPENGHKAHDSKFYNIGG